MSCVFCHQPLDNGQPTTVLGEKGCISINEISSSLPNAFIVDPGQVVHKVCRRDFCRQKEFRRPEKHDTNFTDEYRNLRSEGGFDFQKHCLFCGQNAKLFGCKRGYEVFPVRTFDSQMTIKTICSDRNDNWGNQVLARLEYAHDLPAADAMYHQTCNVNFRTGKQVPSNKMSVDIPHKSPRGRPENPRQVDAFLKVAKHLEDNDGEQITVGDLVKQMNDIYPENAYSVVYMKKKLLEHFKEKIVVTNTEGKPNVITFKETASSILNEFYNQPKDEDAESKKFSIIRTAAKLIKNDIKNMHVNRDVYPSPKEISSVQCQLDYLPESLKVFLSSVYSHSNDLKVASVWQAIFQAARPRVSIPPLQIGLAVQLHNQFSSRFLIDVLNRLGFCSHYKEVMKFEASAAVTDGTTIPGIQDSTFVQFSADNVDHNTRTLDGRDTFHGMGMIASTTPGVNADVVVPRLDVSTDDIIGAGKIMLKFYKPPTEKPEILLKDLGSRDFQDKTENLDLLLNVMRPIKQHLPGWSGFMQSTQEVFFPGISSIKFLPMIDLDPGDMSCIFTTLHFICAEAKRYNTTPILTFDQPLYWKASMIVNNETNASPLRSMVLRLGGFHLQMSFLGSIGHVMQSTGLHEALDTIYAPNAVDHMLNGKAVSRAVRGHLIVDFALNMQLISDVFGVSCNLSKDSTPVNLSTNDSINHCNDSYICDNLQTIASLYDSFVEKKIHIDCVINDPAFQNVKGTLEEKIQELQSYPTARMWLQYMDMIKILKKFIKAERTGDWNLHLQSVHDMLPYLAATGHNKYVKSASLYLQQMTDLQTTHPNVHEQLLNGYHVVRRSNRFWAGLSTDLAIEQTLMRTVKSTGGMTRGKGLTETQRAQWLLSMPVCAAVNSSIQELVDVLYHSSDQHKEMSPARIERDEGDLCTMLTFLEDRKPFAVTKYLRNIETGVTSTDAVNAYVAKDVGVKILKELMGKNVFDVSLKKNKQITTMNGQSTLNTGDKLVTISSQLLFQRLLIAAKGFMDDMQAVFTYELCSVPSALFDNTGSMREAQKSSLADAIWSLGDCSATLSNTEERHYVLDGGSLIHKLHWPHGYTFFGICKLYVDYVKGRYGAPTIIFDGYASGPSTKDVTHQRRTKGVIGTDVIFTGDTPFRSKKDLFLANDRNKQCFISLLTSALKDNGCLVINEAADADVRIVRTAVSCSKSYKVTLIGEDTDLLVLLCFHADMSANDIIFRSDKNVAANRKSKQWSVKKVKEVLGERTCRFLPSVHALSGCDTSSRIFGIGKGSFLKKSISNEALQNYLIKFQDSKSQDDVVDVGERIIASLYGGSDKENLNQTRYRLFTEKTITSLQPVEIHTLPPTTSAAQFHCMRAHFQTQEWTREKYEADPTDWGWKLERGKYIPEKTSMPPAPAELMTIIRCKCKGNCDTKRCSCRKLNLECSVACKECKGSSCSNSAPANDLIPE